MTSAISPIVLAEIERLSESLFEGLCDIIGTKDHVDIRRTIADIYELECGSLNLGGVKVELIFSGSRREGFHFEESDLDALCAIVDFRVIWNSSQRHLYQAFLPVLLTFDCSDSPPGYGLLKVLEERNATLCDSIGFTIMKGKIKYASSSKLKTLICSCSPFYSVHGPCASGSFGTIDVDNAWCIISDIWPPAAASFVNRSAQWPRTNVLNGIFTEGCHLVPIGHKLGRYEKDEWRMSFSVAEQKLIYSMNHSEFLLYGLLKIFLKEVINKVPADEDKLLCSYHMKTAVFWVLQRSTIPECCPQNFLQYFWACLKLILKWVYEGVCPNFFIPENNMFVTNIYGSAQKRLFDKLHKIYEKGLLCLLECPSISAFMLPTLTKGMQIAIPSNHQFMSKLFCELEFYDLLSIACFKNFFEPMRVVEQLVKLNLSPIQRVLVQRLTVNCYKHTTFLLMSVTPDTNRSEYTTHKFVDRALQLSLRCGTVSDLLFHVMYYYTTAKYQKALSITDIVKDRLSQPDMMHKGHSDRELHEEAIRENSLNEVVRKTFVPTVTLFNLVPYICELEIERIKSVQFPFGVLQIPPMVLLHMLEFLCYRHVDMEKAMTALNDLYVLVHFDRGEYISPSYRDISWQILGICQQLTGRLKDALYSYHKSLRQKNVNNISSATMIRIRSVMSDAPKPQSSSYVKKCTFLRNITM